jgi:hypothetical protein
MELLENESDPARPERRQLGIGQAGDVNAGDPDRAARWPVERAHHMQER